MEKRSHFANFHISRNGLNIRTWYGNGKWRITAGVSKDATHDQFILGSADCKNLIAKTVETFHAALEMIPRKSGNINPLVKTMAVEFQPHNIRVNAIAPGYLNNIMDGVVRPTTPPMCITMCQTSA